MSLISLNINGIEVRGTQGQTVLEIARENGIEIPTLCFDERVEVYGSCGLCVVEIEGIPKLLRSCATQASDGMIVKTNTNRVKESRKTALELLLSDHTGDCKAPCTLACPGNTDCQGYVGLIANGQFREALELIKEQLPLPASIGRVCPHPCETACRRQLVEEPISIATLKAFAADMDMKSGDMFIPEIAPATGKHVGIIGGGPGGLSAAYYLLSYGHKVTIYDAMPQMGGMLRYGIPQYRLPKNIVDEEIAVIEKMGATLVNNVKIGKDLDLEYVKSKHDALFVAIGAWKSSNMRCPGEDLPGVIGGIDFLRKVTLDEPLHVGKKVAVVGGGNTAMDACRTAIRLGAEEVYVLYRRTRDEMPAEDIEILEAEEEGVVFKYLVSPIEILEEDGVAKKVRLQKMELGEPDASGRRRPLPIEGEEEILEVDLVIAAIGQNVDMSGLTGLEATKWGTIVTDESTFSTSEEGIFAGGDSINDGAGIAIEAIGDAKNAAVIMDRYLSGEKIKFEEPYYVKRNDVTAETFKDKKIQQRPKMTHLHPAERRDNFEEVAKGYSPEQAVEDAKRCLECGCGDVYECKLLAYSNDYKVKPEVFEGEVHSRETDDGHPYIVRNADKCILCGLCVRVCDQVMDNGALGLVDRGFDTVVKPSLDRPLAQTSCISCGQCISVCPVGALQERLQMEKPVPVHKKSTQSVCSFCSVGCDIEVQSKGDRIFRVLPSMESKTGKGLLCSKGRFGYNEQFDSSRITEPMMKKHGAFVPVSWDQALRAIAKGMQRVKLTSADAALAVCVSDRYSNEEIYLAKKLTQEYFKTDKLACFNQTVGGLQDVFGLDASTNTFDELESADFILLIGGDVMANHTIAGLRIYEGIKKGAKLGVIGNKDTHSNEWASYCVAPDNDLSVLQQFAKALLDMGASPADVHELDTLKSVLADTVVSEEIAAMAESFYKSSKAMIVFEQNEVTSQAARWIGNIALLAEKIGQPRRGVVQLKPRNNSQGLADIGVHMDSSLISREILEGKIKGMLVLGEDLPEMDLSNLEFLAVQDFYMTPTALEADVIIPAVSWAETEGSLTNSERRYQCFSQAITTKVEKQNWEFFAGLIQLLGGQIGYESIWDVNEEMRKETPAYNGIQSGEIWPAKGSNVLYEERFATEDGKATLATEMDGALYQDRVPTDFALKKFLEKLTDL